MLLRELVARLGLQVDDRSFKRADRSIEAVGSSLRTLTAAFAAVAGAAGIGRLVTLASDANETLNVLRASFGENQAAVEAWASTTAKEVGRSEFRLREMAGTLGALLNPLMEGNAEAAATMSTGLAQLAVDLGSFFNVSDDEALIALRAGISGETEPLKRLGVVLTEVALEQQAHNEGITKSVKNMTIAEKTALRYRTILAQTVNAQGDAARTSEGFANASKALGDSMRDLGTRIGLSVLPTVERMIRGARDLVGNLAGLVETSNLAQGAVLALTAAGIAWGFSLIPALLVVLKVGAALAALSLILDDVLTLFDGGTSLVGAFIDEIFGLGAADEFVAAHRTGVELMADAWAQAEGDVGAFFSTLLGFEGDLQDFAGMLDEIGAQIFEIGDAVANFFGSLPDQVVALVGDLLGEQTQARQRLEDRQFARGNQRQLARGVDAVGTEVTRFQQRSLENQDALRQRREQRRLRRLAREAGADVEGLTFQRTNEAQRRGIDSQAEIVRFGRARIADRSQRGAADAIIQGDNVQITIDAAGDPAEVERRLRNLMEERSRQKRRKAASALAQVTEGG